MMTPTDWAFLESVGIVEGNSAERYQMRCIALEAQNKALWTHIDNLTVTSAFHEDRAEKWRGRWARVFGVAMVEGLAVAGLVYHIWKG